MRILTLMEDTTEDTRLFAEHGLSFLIETDAAKILFDTGASEKTCANARLLGKDLSALDAVVLSHGHYDHTGGLFGILAIDPSVSVYIREEAFGAFYHGEKYIGSDRDVLHRANFVPIRDTGVKEIGKGVYLFSGAPLAVPMPRGNAELTVRTEDGDFPDPFLHEQYLWVTEGKTAALFTGCAHRGICNILLHSRNLFGRDPDLVFGGFHMAKKTSLTEKDLFDCRECAERLSAFSASFFTGHCTGEDAFCAMKPILGDRLSLLHTGSAAESAENFCGQDR